MGSVISKPSSRSPAQPASLPEVFPKDWETRIFWEDTTSFAALSNAGCVVLSLPVSLSFGRCPKRPCWSPSPLTENRNLLPLFTKQSQNPTPLTALPSRSTSLTLACHCFYVLCHCGFQLLVLCYLCHPWIHENLAFSMDAQFSTTWGFQFLGTLNNGSHFFHTFSGHQFPHPSPYLRFQPQSLDFLIDLLHSSHLYCDQFLEGSPIHWFLPLSITLSPPVLSHPHQLQSQSLSFHHFLCFKVFTAFVTVLLLFFCSFYFYVFRFFFFFNWPQSTWELSSRTRDQTHTSYIGGEVLTTGHPDIWIAFSSFVPSALYPPYLKSPYTRRTQMLVFLCLKRTAEFCREKPQNGMESQHNTCSMVNSRSPTLTPWYPIIFD